MVRQTIIFLVIMVSLMPLVGCGVVSSNPISSLPTVSPLRETPSEETATPPISHPPTLTVATPKPTLSTDQRENKILELLQTNGKCDLPCWWGIMPGTSTWSQTQGFLEGLDVKLFVYRTIGNATDYSTSGEDIASRNIHNGVGFTEQDGIVKQISIETSSIDLNNSSGWLEAWSSYSPEKIFSKYGNPDRVWLMASSQVHESPGTSQMPYELWLFYDHLKFLIRYSGVVEYAPVYRFCPEYGQNGQLTPELRIFLADPANPTPLESLSNALSIPGMAEYIQPIEKATGLTMRQFSSLFTQSGKKTCFDVPRDMWP